MISDFEIRDQPGKCCKCFKFANVLCYCSTIYSDKIRNEYYCHACFKKYASKADYKYYIKLNKFRRDKLILQKDFENLEILMERYPNKKIFPVLYNFLKIRHKQYRYITRIIYCYLQNKIPPAFLFFKLKERINTLLDELSDNRQRRNKPSTKRNVSYYGPGSHNFP